MPDIKDIISHIVEHLDTDEKKVMKTVPATAAEITAWKKLRQIRIDAVKMEREAESKKKLFWGKVEERTGIYGHSLRFNAKTAEIEVLEGDLDEAENEQVASPKES